MRLPAVGGVAIVLALGFAGPARGDDGNLCSIEKAVIHHMQPAGVKDPPNVDRVAIEDSYALAGWTAGEAGGTAVLRKTSLGWKVLSEAGGWDSRVGLIEQGVPTAIARKLADDFGMK